MIGFLDIETGGFSIEKNGVCEIAVVTAGLDLKPVDEFHCLIQPYTRPCGVEMVSYKDDAMQINGLTVERLQAEGIPVQLAMQFLKAFMTKHHIIKLIGHNIPTFDIPRINYLLGRFAGTALGQTDVTCTLKMAREKWSGLISYKQPDLCTMLNIPNPDAHSAKGDCYANIELYKRLL